MPPWGCRCGTDDNWASRSSCRGCGAAAPRKVLDAIASAAKRPMPSAHPQPWGRWKHGAPGHGKPADQMQRKLDVLERKLSKIQEENKKLKHDAKGETTPPAAGSTTEEGVDV